MPTSPRRRSSQLMTRMRPPSLCRNLRLAEDRPRREPPSDRNALTGSADGTAVDHVGCTAAVETTSPMEESQGERHDADEEERRQEADAKRQDCPHTGP